MPLTRFPHGVSSFGQTIYGTGIPHLGPLGKLFVVVSTDAKFNYLSAKLGEDKDLKVPQVYLQNATNDGIQGALDNCRSSYGDVVMIEPGYYTVANQITLTKNHITLMARSDSRIATVLFGSSAAGGANSYGDLLKITGGYYRIEGLSLYTYNNAASAILLDDAPSGADAGGFGQIVNCTFPPEGGGVDSELFGIDVKGANNVTIAGCEFVGQKQGGIRFRGGVGNPINPRVYSCKFTGCVSGIELATAVYNGIVQDSWCGTTAYPTGQSITNFILDGGTGEWSMIDCTGSVTAANAVGGAEASTIIGDGAGGYTQLT